MHTEKQEIFDRYALSVGFITWGKLVEKSANYSVIKHTFNACDLVQKAQQERIAENAIEVDLNDGEYEVVTKQNILSEQNLIK